MTPTGMPAVHCRIGALAASLGLGAALMIGLGSGVAAAEDTGSGSDRDSSRAESRDTDDSGSSDKPTNATGSQRDQSERDPGSRRGTLKSRLPDRAGPGDRLGTRIRAAVREAVDAAAARREDRLFGKNPEAAPADETLPDAEVDNGAAAERTEAASNLRRGTELDRVAAQRPRLLPRILDAGADTAPSRLVEMDMPAITEPAARPERIPEPPRTLITLAPNRITPSIDAPEAAPAPSASVVRAPILTRVFDAMFRTSASGTAPVAPAAAPIGWAALAFARREFEPAQRIPALAEFLGAGRQVSESAELVSTPVAIAPGIVLPPRLYEHTTVTGNPSLTDQITNIGLSVMKAISEVVGFNISYELSALMSSAKPPWFTTVGLDVKQSEYTFDDDGEETTWKVWEIASPNPSGEYVVAVHGGAFVNQPNMIQWLDYASMARDTGATVVVPIFPMVTPKEGGNAENIVVPMADFISGYVDAHGADQVSVYGDSSGGLIAMLAVQQMVRDCTAVSTCETALPSRMVLISPALGGDDFMNDPNAQLVNDPVSMLPKPGEGPDWQGDLPDGSPLWDPTQGSAAGLPPTVIYLGTRDILTPSALLFADRMLEEGSDVRVVLGKGQIHNWAMGGLPSNSQAPKYRRAIYRELGLLDEGAQTT